MTQHKSIEQADHRFGEPCEVAECFNDRSADAHFIDDYLKGYREICLRARNWRPSDYGAFIKSRPGVGEFRFLAERSGIDNDSRWANLNRDQSFVFAENIELVEHNQVVVPSMVRLDRLYQPAFRGRERLYEISPLIIVAPEVISAFGDRKINTIADYVATHSDSVSDEIKARAKTIDDRASLGVNDRWQGLDVAKLKQLLANLRVRLDANIVRISIAPGFEALLQDWDLGYGPIYSSLSVRKIIA